MLDGFRKNPTFLWGHQSRTQDPTNVLGRVVSVEVVPAGLLATFEYDTDINPKADLVFRQVQKGTVRGFSVGFIPKTWVTDYSPKDHVEALPEQARKALEEGKAFVVYTAAELVEISQVPIPSNPDALVGASAKSVRLQELRKLEESTMEKQPVPAVEKAIEPDITAIVKAAVAEAIAPLQEQIAKLAAPVVAEKAPEVVEVVEPSLAQRALDTLAALPADKLDATLAAMTTDERKALLALVH